MKDEIGAHMQLSGEAMHHTWWRFCQRLKKCLNHGLNERHLKRIFYRSLNFVTKPIVDAFCGGSVTRKPFLEIVIVIYDVSNNNRAWHTKDAEVRDLGITFELLAEERRRKGSRYGSNENLNGSTQKTYHDKF
ncbi:hypothetical protein KY285_003549 [Solanum tuberosum]|nr:hypothetical protein KY285_003549 [Solanum tuberosum]